MSRKDFLNPAVFGVGAVVEKNSKFLLVQEARTMEEIGKEEGMHSFPSGFVKPNETPVETIIREFEEEAGYVIDVVDIIGLYVVKGAVGIAFRGRIISKSKKGYKDKDVKAVNWYAAEEIRRLILRPANKEILDDYLAGKSFPLSMITDTR